MKDCGNCGYLRRQCPVAPDVCVLHWYSHWKSESEFYKCSDCGGDAKVLNSWRESNGKGGHCLVCVKCGRHWDVAVVV